MNRKFTLGTVLKFIFLGALAVIFLFPIVYILLASFKSNTEILTAGNKILPEKFVFDNYKEAWELANFKQYLFNSVYMSFFIVIGSIMVATVSGYVFERGNFPGKKIIFTTIIASMFISVGSISLYPQVQIAKFLGINASLWGVILIRIFGMNVLQFFISKNFVKTIPKEVDEAAKIDGCSFFRIYWNIILPLLKPLIATVGLLSFRLAWNDYLLPLVFTMGSPKNTPLIVGVINLKNSGEAASSWNLMLAGTTMSIVPMLVVYIVLNKYFVSGLTSGAVKG